MTEELQVEYTVLDTVSIQANATLYKDGIKILPYTTNIPKEIVRQMTVASYKPYAETINVTTAETEVILDYNTATSYDITFTNADGITNSNIKLNAINIPDYDQINVRINNTNANTISFNTHTIINSTETNTYNIIFKNNGNNIVLYGNKIEQFN